MGFSLNGSEAVVGAARPPLLLLSDLAVSGSWKSGRRGETLTATNTGNATLLVYGVLSWTDLKNDMKLETGDESIHWHRGLT